MSINLLPEAPELLSPPCSLVHTTHPPAWKQLGRAAAPLQQGDGHPFCLSCQKSPPSRVCCVCLFPPLVQWFEKRHFLALDGDLVSGLTPKKQAASKQIGGIQGAVPHPHSTGAAGWSRGHHLMNSALWHFGRHETFAQSACECPAVKQPHFHC